MIDLNDSGVAAGRCDRERCDALMVCRIDVAPCSDERVHLMAVASSASRNMGIGSAYTCLHTLQISTHMCRKCELSNSIYITGGALIQTHIQMHKRKYRRPYCLDEIVA